MPPLTIAEIDANQGLVTLSDRRRWQVQPGDMTTIATGLPKHRVHVRGGVSAEIENVDDGSTVRTWAIG